MIGLESGNPILRRYLLIQRAWVIAWGNAIYSASTVESATVSCFLLSHDIGPPTTRKIFPLVGHRVSLHLSWLGKTTKSLFIFLFFSFLLLLSWTYYTEGSVGKCHITRQEVIVSHHMMPHDQSHNRHGKIVHRPYSSCISSIENLTGTLLSSLC